MSTVEYIIKVVNISGSTENYMLFSQQPEPSTTVGKIYTNIWVTSPGVPSPRGQARYSIKTANFAICGTTPEPITYGAVVSTSDYAPVQLASKDLPGTVPVMEIVGGGPQFVEPYGSTRKDNSFGIETKPFDMERYKTVYVGYGKNNEKGEVVPVAVWQAQSATRYDLTPIAQYYIGTGDFHAGTTVDITTIGQIAKVDFTKAPSGQTIAIVTHNPDRTYKVEFEYPPKMKPYRVNVE
ncbi:hypothetical protein MY4824_004189 [Beauveria thailandica]